MPETLRSVGIDVGTTTTQLIVSRLQVQNVAGSFTVPELRVTEREVVYRSPVHFTPLLDEQTIDAPALRELLGAEYRRAGIERGTVQTGAVIITGETARKRNAEAVARAIADLAGDFVVATAGPALESVLAARGAGADALSEELNRPVIHLDIGGGTTNLSLWQDGQLQDTGCYNIGGRLLRFTPDGIILGISPQLAPHISLAPGQHVNPDELMPIVTMLVQALEEAVGLRPRTVLSDRFITDKALTLPTGGACLSFSGGVADLIYRDDDPNWLAYGDLGVLLARAIRSSPLVQRDSRRGRETIRATVIGAGSHSMELSGSTVYCRGHTLPLQNLPVLRLQDEAAIDTLPEAFSRYDEPLVAVALEGLPSPSYSYVAALAGRLATALRDRSSAVIILRHDMAKSLGYALQPLFGDKPLLCLDRLTVPEGSYLDIGEAVGSALPVVIKTLIFSL